MKRKIKYMILSIMSIFIIFSSNIVYAVEEKDEYIKEYKDNIYHMSKMMRCIPKTGDINLDYLYEIAMLSEGEVEFSQAYIKYASCNEVKNLAEGYIERETAAINNIKSIIEKLKDNPEKNEEEEYLKIYNDELNNMICKFQKVELTENIDTNYLKCISVHHKGVIAITEEFLKLSENSEVKEIAQKLSNEMKNDFNAINKLL